MFDKVKENIKAAIEDVAGVSQEEPAGIYQGLTFSPDMLAAIQEFEQVDESVGDAGRLNMLEHHFGLDIRVVPSVTELAKK